MLKRLKGFWDWLTAKSTPIQVISGIMGIAAGVWAFFGIAFWPLLTFVGSISIAIWTFSQASDLTPFIAGSSSAVVFLSAYWLVRTDSKARKAGLKDPNPTLRILSSKRICVVRSPKKIDYQYHFRVRAREQNVQVFNLAFSWTGVGQIEFRANNGRLHHKFVDLRGTSSTMLHVIFERPLARGAVLEFGFELITDGSMRVQRPFFAETIFRHTPKRGSAIIGVHFDEGVAVQSLWKEEYADQAAHWPYKHEQVQIPDDGKFEWPLEAAVNRRCCISWEYAAE